MSAPDLQLDWIDARQREREEARRRDRERDQERLLPLVLSLAATVGARGFTASDVLEIAFVANVFPRDVDRRDDRSKPEIARRFAWLGPWLASLARRGTIAAKTIDVDGHPVQVTRRSERSSAHGNRNGVYLAVEVAG